MSRIPAADKADYQRWEMPDLTGINRRIRERLQEIEQAEQQEEAATPEPTPEEIAAEKAAQARLAREQELAQIREQAYQEGFTQGQQAGLEQGYQDGFAQGQQAGHTQGLEQGIQEGIQEGLNQGQEQLDQIKSRLQHLIQHLREPLARQDDELEEVLLSLVQMLCQAILLRELSINRRHLLMIVREAIQALPPMSERLFVYVHPEDIELAGEACAGVPEACRVFADENMTPGGCRVETQNSLVDYTFERRFQDILRLAVEKRYSQALPQPHPQEDLDAWEEAYLPAEAQAQVSSSPAQALEWQDVVPVIDDLQDLSQELKALRALRQGPFVAKANWQIEDDEMLDAETSVAVGPEVEQATETQEKDQQEDVAETTDVAPSSDMSAADEAISDTSETPEAVSSDILETAEVSSEPLDTQQPENQCQDQPTAELEQALEEDRATQVEEMPEETASTSSVEETPSLADEASAQAVEDALPSDMPEEVPENQAIEPLEKDDLMPDTRTGAWPEDIEPLDTAVLGEVPPLPPAESLEPTPSMPLEPASYASLEDLEPLQTWPGLQDAEHLWEPQAPSAEQKLATNAAVIEDRYLPDEEEQAVPLDEALDLSAFEAEENTPLEKAKTSEDTDKAKLEQVQSQLNPEAAQWDDLDLEQLFTDDKQTKEP
ncbi:flagellar assembly protein FliH [Allopseudospirillum japonicum]|nr:flagellar assembly protein FliH [Allopseudospirillum japonicum]